VGKTTAAAFNEACASLRVDHQQCTVDLAQLSDLHDESSVGSATLVSSLRKETQEAREELEKVFFLRTVNRNAWVYSMDVRMTRNEEKKKKLLFQLDFFVFFVVFTSLLSTSSLLLLVFFSHECFRACHSFFWGGQYIY